MAFQSMSHLSFMSAITVASSFSAIMAAASHSREEGDKVKSFSFLHGHFDPGRFTNVNSCHGRSIILNMILTLISTQISYRALFRTTRVPMKILFLTVNMRSFDQPFWVVNLWLKAVLEPRLTASDSKASNTPIDGIRLSQISWMRSKIILSLVPFDTLLGFCST
ncbi:hypothetical protein HN873_066648 [Arachis hypogaea]